MTRRTDTSADRAAYSWLDLGLLVVALVLLIPLVLHLAAIVVAALRGS